MKLVYEIGMRWPRNFVVPSATLYRSQYNTNFALVKTIDTHPSGLISRSMLIHRSSKAHWHHFLHWRRKHLQVMVQHAGEEFEDLFFNFFITLIGDISKVEVSSKG